MKTNRNDRRDRGKTQNDLKIWPGKISSLGPDREDCRHQNQRKELAAHSTATKPTSPFRSGGPEPAHLSRSSAAANQGSLLPIQAVGNPRDRVKESPPTTERRNRSNCKLAWLRGNHAPLG